MVNRGLADCSLRCLCPPESCSNQGDTSRCTIPRRCPPCRKGRNHSAGNSSPARCRHTHLQPRLSLETFPATCSPSISHRDEIHRPKRTFFRINHRVPQTRTPLQSADVCRPISHKLPHPDKRFERQDISPSL